MSALTSYTCKLCHTVESTDTVTDKYPREVRKKKELWRCCDCIKKVKDEAKAEKDAKDLVIALEKEKKDAEMAAFIAAKAKYGSITKAPKSRPKHYSRGSGGSDSGPVSSSWWDRQSLDIYFFDLENIGLHFTNDLISPGQWIVHTSSRGSSESSMGYTTEYSASVYVTSGVITDVINEGDVLQITILWKEVETKQEDVETQGKGIFTVDACALQELEVINLKEWK